MTPLIAELHNAHKERLARFARAAITEKPCEIVVRKPEPVQEPEAVLAKPCWFSIVEEIHGFDSSDLNLSSIPDIQRAVCKYFGLTKRELLSRRRDHEIMIPRQIAIYLSKTLTLRTLPEIGRIFGGFDHTTILHNVRITEKRMRANWVLAFDIAHIEGMLS
jgi:hypothetical protein